MGIVGPLIFGNTHMAYGPILQRQKEAVTGAGEIAFPDSNSLVIFDLFEGKQTEPKYFGYQ